LARGEADVAKRYHQRRAPHTARIANAIRTQ
jgi:hypothetical protein